MSVLNQTGVLHAYQSVAVSQKVMHRSGDSPNTLAAAQASQVPQPVLDAVHQSFATARTDSFGKIDSPGIADVLCESAGITKPRLPSGWKPS